MLNYVYGFGHILITGVRLANVGVFEPEVIWMRRWRAKLSAYTKLHL